MNDDTAAAVEKMLEPLIRRHGIAKVLDDLARLIPRSRWPDYQRVHNLARNINHRLQREAKQAA